jgi:hypothetical protein
VPYIETSVVATSTLTPQKIYIYRSLRKTVLVPRYALAENTWHKMLHNLKKKALKPAE